MRLNSRALAFHDDRAFYDDKPFTGVGFHLENGIAQQVIEYQNGYAYCDYHSKWLPIDGSQLAVDKDFLDDPEGYEPILYKGQRFTGVVYEFMDLECVSESVIKDGINIEEATSFDGNTLAAYEGGANGFMEYIYWHPNESLKRLEIGQEGKFLAEFDFNEEGQLESAIVKSNENIFDYMKKLNFKFLQFNNVEFFGSISAAPNLRLIGSGIRDDFFNQIASSDGLTNIETIVIFNTSLSNNCISILKKYFNIKKIDIDEQNSNWLGPLKQLKKFNPGCEIEFNEEEIIYQSY